VKNSDTSFHVRHECPQCGAPVTLLEDDRMFSCAYCRVKLFLQSRDFFRYCIPPAEDVHEEIFYVPYWRFRGLYYTVVPFSLQGRVLDQTFLASGHGAFPNNLGFRPQVLTLRFASSAPPGRFLLPKIPFRDLTSLAEEKASFFGASGTAFLRAFIGRTAGMIYAPVYIRDGAVHDAVLKRPLSAWTPATEEEFRSAGPRTTWNVEFLSTLCPECGWQLSGENESAAFLCGNCVSAWELSGGGLKRTEFIVAPGEKQGLYYAPFWRMSVAAEGIELRTYADLVRTANLPKAVRPEWERQELFFWLPAFRTNPNQFLRLAKLLTFAQPRIVNDDRRVRTSSTSFEPITLGAGDAAGGLKAVLALLANDSRKLYPLLPEVGLQLKSAALVLLPFERNGAELTEAGLNFSIPR
jgi:DNA-directed RNA polymerase subunit RPC12/RpoP